MGQHWVGVTIDCADPVALSAFWSALLDRPVTDEHSDDVYATVGSRRDAQPRLTFQRVAEPRVGKVRLHLDLQVDDIGTSAARVEQLGGRFTGERHDYDEGSVLVMEDPEGNAFCLVFFRSGQGTS
jgi:predicted enzyme related to lactoylglutathione lyase